METNGIWNTSESIKSAFFRDSKEVDIYVAEPQHIIYENMSNWEKGYNQCIRPEQLALDF
jgi:hypothetical protein